MASDDAAFAQFAEYIAREMPEGTIIGDPAWWAPRLWRFARYANGFEAGRVNAPQGTMSELVAERPKGSASESPALLTSNEQRLTLCLQAVMAELVDLLDSDQFSRIEAIVLRADVPYPPLGTDPRTQLPVETTARHPFGNGTRESLKKGIELCHDHGHAGDATTLAEILLWLGPDTRPAPKSDGDYPHIMAAIERGDQK